MLDGRGRSSTCGCTPGSSASTRPGSRPRAARPARGSPSGSASTTTWPTPAAPTRSLRESSRAGVPGRRRRPDVIRSAVHQAGHRRPGARALGAQVVLRAPGLGPRYAQGTPALRGRLADQPRIVGRPAGHPLLCRARRAAPRPRAGRGRGSITRGSAPALKARLDPTGVECVVRHAQGFPRVGRSRGGHVPRDDGVLPAASPPVNSRVFLAASAAGITGIHPERPTAMPSQPFGIVRLGRVRAAPRARPVIEALECRALLTGNLWITSAELVNASEQPIAAPVVGEEVFVEAQWMSSGLSSLRRLFRAVLSGRRHARLIDDRRTIRR